MTLMDVHCSLQSAGGLQSQAVVEQIYNLGYYRVSNIVTEDFRFALYVWHIFE